MHRTVLLSLPAVLLNLVLIHVAALKAEEPKPSGKPALKQVLIIGDSISNGYFNAAKQQLKDAATLTHNRGNARFTTYGVKELDNWLGDKKWDLIQFNFGLWDMYGWSQKPKLTVEQYEKQLEMIAVRLKKTDAKIIFANTTPVCPAPEVTAKIIVSKETEKKFAEAAARVMKKHDIAVNDLYSLIAADRKKYARGDNDVHYNDEGRQLLGSAVAKMIRQELPEPVIAP